MPIFPVLDTEDKVQIDDKTRLDASKSFVSNTTAITTREIKPGKGESYVTLDSTNQYLDWMFDFTVDVDATNNKLDFDEGGAELTATLASGNYTLATLATEIQTKMNTAGGTYTVSVEDNVFTIAGSQAFSLHTSSGTNIDTSIFSHIGFTDTTADEDGASTYTGDEVKSVIKTVYLRVTNATLNDVVTKDMTVFSVDGDKLYSTDDRLRNHEPEIMRYVRAGRTTHKDVHRRCQEMILMWLDKEGHVDYYGNKYTKDTLADTEEVQEWATFMALRLIHEGRSNAIDDIFAEKAKRYKELEVYNRERAILRLDLDGDGAISDGEISDPRAGIVVRR